MLTDDFLIALDKKYLNEEIYSEVEFILNRLNVVYYELNSNADIKRDYYQYQIVFLEELLTLCNDFEEDGLVGFYFFENHYSEYMLNLIKGEYLQEYFGITNGTMISPKRESLNKLINSIKKRLCKLKELNPKILSINEIFESNFFYDKKFEKKIIELYTEYPLISFPVLLGKLKKEFSQIEVGEMFFHIEKLIEINRIKRITEIEDNDNTQLSSNIDNCLSEKTNIDYSIIKNNNKEVLYNHPYFANYIDKVKLDRQREYILEVFEQWKKPLTIGQIKEILFEDYHVRIKSKKVLVIIVELLAGRILFDSQTNYFYLRNDSLANVSEEGNSLANVSEEGNSLANVSEEGNSLANVSEGDSSLANVSEGDSSLANVSEGDSSLANVSEGDIGLVNDSEWESSLDNESEWDSGIFIKEKGTQKTVYSLYKPKIRINDQKTKVFLDFDYNSLIESDRLAKTLDVKLEELKDYYELKEVNTNRIVLTVQRHYDYYSVVQVGAALEFECLSDLKFIAIYEEEIFLLEDFVDTSFDFDKPMLWQKIDEGYQYVNKKNVDTLVGFVSYPEGCTYVGNSTLEVKMSIVGRTDICFMSFSGEILFEQSDGKEYTFKANNLKKLDLSIADGQPWWIKKIINGLLVINDRVPFENLLRVYDIEKKKTLNSKEYIVTIKRDKEWDTDLSKVVLGKNTIKIQYNQIEEEFDLFNVGDLNFTFTKDLQSPIITFNTIDFEIIWYENNIIDNIQEFDNQKVDVQLKNTGDLSKMLKFRIVPKSNRQAGLIFEINSPFQGLQLMCAIDEGNSSVECEEKSIYFDNLSDYYLDVQEFDEKIFYKISFSTDSIEDLEIKETVTNNSRVYLSQYKEQIQTLMSFNNLDDLNSKVMCKIHKCFLDKRSSLLYEYTIYNSKWSRDAGKISSSKFLDELVKDNFITLFMEELQVSEDLNDSKKLSIKVLPTKEIIAKEGEFIISDEVKECIITGKNEKGLDILPTYINNQNMLVSSQNILHYNQLSSQDFLQSNVWEKVYAYINFSYDRNISFKNINLLNVIFTDPYLIAKMYCLLIENKLDHTIEKIETEYGFRFLWVTSLVSKILEDSSNRLSNSRKIKDKLSRFSTTTNTLHQNIQNLKGKMGDKIKDQMIKFSDTMLEMEIVKKNMDSCKTFNHDDTKYVKSISIAPMIVALAVKGKLPELFTDERFYLERRKIMYVESFSKIDFDGAVSLYVKILPNN